MWKTMQRVLICSGTGSSFETYNIGGHNEKQNIEIIHIILDTLNEMLPDEDPRKAHINEELITYVEDRKGHDRRYAIAPDKIKLRLAGIRRRCLQKASRKQSNGILNTKTGWQM